ncbi:Glutamate 5-kinase [Slackia heliotrinireducens]|uniref:Glutamate 5-kinase n=1 Tax=Slackia heliotrinireducens (strain ATCC 29202 / DSM 20476 / NCTC 11029 / RHS 1) TaxID=471855 RepID=C7N5Z5_SLAHD|nr:glutamate 5-kinase [Slackia heliotrinireducens]ACV22330.1 glutamate 5-kinase [Slackia heliotrinireducens DSM 20476]VEH00562.1 Glutamate 5-kinase [Slackia heliotrinireducens]
MEEAKQKVAVIKIGSSTLTTADGQADQMFLADLAHQVWRMRNKGWGVVIVSSGAIPCGLRTMGLPIKRPKDMPTVQAAASVGTRVLLAAYDQAFSPYSILTSLVLLTRRDTADRNAYLHARDTFLRLIELGVVPIVNENDTVSVEQIKFGDNDTLAALVACLIGADRVVIMSDIDGLYTANPQTNPDAEIIRVVDRITPEIMQGASGAGSSVGSGGMVTKLTSARVLGAAGISLVICHGRAEEVIVRSLEDEPRIGTLFSAHEPRHEITPRKLWIALGNSTKARITVDRGAAAALLGHGKSLLAAGIKHVDNDFDEGDVLDVIDMDGFVIARGLAKCSSEGLNKDSGVVIHRDELMVFE